MKLYRNSKFFSKSIHNDEGAKRILGKDVENKYKVHSGFINKNIENFRYEVDKRGWSNFLVMTSINKTSKSLYIILE